MTILEAVNTHIHGIVGYGSKMIHNLEELSSEADIFTQVVFCTVTTNESGRSDIRYVLKKREVHHLGYVSALYRVVRENRFLHRKSRKNRKNNFRRRHGICRSITRLHTKKQFYSSFYVIFH